MKKNDWKDVVRCIRLMKYGMGLKQCIGTMILFAGIGIVFEMLIVLGEGGQYLNRALDFGALFMYSAAMYPAQVLMTLDISGMVQASPYKKRIQTSAVSLLSLCCNLGVLVILVLLRWLGVCLMPERAPWIWDTLPAIGIMGMALSIMSVLMYKFYILSIFMLAGVCGAIGSISFYQRVGTEPASSGLALMSLPAAVAFCIGMIILGNTVQYLLARVIYKRPYSKGAFGNAVGKKFV